MEDNQHYSRGEVGEGTLESETDGQTGGGDDSYKQSGFHAQRIEGGQQDKDHQDNAGQADDKLDQRFIGFGFAQQSADKAGHKTYRNATKDKYGCGFEDGGAVQPDPFHDFSSR